MVWWYSTKHLMISKLLTLMMVPLTKYTSNRKKLDLVVPALPAFGRIFKYRHNMWKDILKLCQLSGSLSPKCHICCQHQSKLAILFGNDFDKSDVFLVQKVCEVNFSILSVMEHFHMATPRAFHSHICSQTSALYKGYMSRHKATHLLQLCLSTLKHPSQETTLNP